MNRPLLTLTAAALVVIPGRTLLAQASDAERPLRILIVNDDGYQAPGLVALVEALGILDGMTRLSLLWQLPAEQSKGEHA